MIEGAAPPNELMSLVTWFPLIAAALGAFTAGLIAFCAYPWQKEKDRAFKLQEERREAYRRFVVAALKHIDDLLTARAKVGDGDIDRLGARIGDAKAEMAVELCLLALVSDADVFKIANDMVGEFETSLSEAREGLERDVDYDGAEVIGIFQGLIGDAAIKMKHRLPELLGAMRAKEFSEKRANGTFELKLKD